MPHKHDMGEDVTVCLPYLQLPSDIKCVIQCSYCANYYHGKCENMDIRGFHLRKDQIMDNLARKRFRSNASENIEINKNSVMELLMHIEKLTEIFEEMN